MALYTATISWRRQGSADAGELHRQAHEPCDLANSVKTAIRVEP